MTSAPGEILFTDVCGPMPMSSMGGYGYFVSFMDGNIRYKEIRLVKNKSDVLSYFRLVRAKLERKFDCRIKTLYSYNGGEYVGLQQELEELCIEWEYCAPYKPEENGVAKRLSKKIMETMRTMLIHSGLPDTFWGKAFITTATIRKITGTKNLKGKTPFEALTGNKPDVGNLRIFGCEVWIHDASQNKKKVDTRSKRRILLRCMPQLNYSVWNIEERRVVHSRHVRFNDHVFPAREWTKRHASQVCAALEEMCKLINICQGSEALTESAQHDGSVENSEYIVDNDDKTTAGADAEFSPQEVGEMLTY